MHLREHEGVDVRRRQLGEEAGSTMDGWTGRRAGAERDVRRRARLRGSAGCRPRSRAQQRAPRGRGTGRGSRPVRGVSALQVGRVRGTHAREEMREAVARGGLIRGRGRDTILEIVDERVGRRGERLLQLAVGRAGHCAPSAGGVLGWARGGP